MTLDTSPSRYEIVLEYWFRNWLSQPAEPITQAGVKTSTADHAPAPGRPAARVELEELSRFWFQQSDETDQFIRTHFEKDLQRALAGGYDSWKNHPRSCLAWIILLDQFSLNLYREEARSFDQSARAVAVALDAIRRGWDQMVAPHERVFFYMPLMHAENIELQEQSVAAFQKLLQDAPASQRPVYESFVEYAKLHWDVVQRFGRFPDRNAAYGRPSTENEERYLAAGGPPF